MSNDLDVSINISNMVNKNTYRPKKNAIKNNLDNAKMNENIKYINNKRGKNMYSPEQFDTKEKYFYKMIDKFYNKCELKIVNDMVDIVNGDSNISLRILDWFVTKYSNKNKILLTNDDGIIFDVHISYKAQLKSYKKKYFDPFKRREKFDYTFIVNNKTIYTTIGQLNFFRWVIENGIISFITNNFASLSKDMNISNKDDKRKKTEKNIRKKISKTKNISIIENKYVKKISNEKNIDFNNDIKINASKRIDNNEFKIILTFD